MCSDEELHFNCAKEERVEEVKEGGEESRGVAPGVAGDQRKAQAGGGRIEEEAGAVDTGGHQEC